MIFKKLLLINTLFMLAVTLSAQVNFIELQSDKVIYGDLGNYKKGFKKQVKGTVLLKDSNNLANFLNSLNSQLTEQHPKILFFIHGWWESKPSHMAECVEYLQSTFLENEKSKIGTVVFITWNAAHLNYKVSQKEAFRVAPTFRFLLENIYRFQTENQVSCNLISHSLGNFVLYHALNEEKRIFDKLLMSAPDIPILNSKNKLAYQRIENVANDILLMRNKKDKSLLSSAIVNGQQRLGRIGFSKSYKGKIKTKDVHQFNDVKDWKGRLTNHIHYRTSPKAIELAFDFFMD